MNKGCVKLPAKETVFKGTISFCSRDESRVIQLCIFATFLAIAPQSEEKAPSDIEEFSAIEKYFDANAFKKMPVVEKRRYLGLYQQHLDMKKFG
jgi:hypothetical protein